MEPIISLPYTEYAVANHLAKYFKQKDGYSIYAPLSRQEKGVDLLLMKRINKVSKSITIQVKASRTYSPEPPKRILTKRYAFYTWFNRFDVPKEADLIALIGLYPPADDRTMKLNSWWDAVILMFTNEEMINFIANTNTVSGKKDKMFGFGFDNKYNIYQTRGDCNRNYKDYSLYLLENRIKFINNLFL